jgi:acetate kinase
LHNPANLEGINVAEEILVQQKTSSSFDTFHQTIPVGAQICGTQLLLTENKIRVYGFHGTSHKYVSENAIHYLEQNSKNKGSKSLPYI